MMHCYIKPSKGIKSNMAPPGLATTLKHCFALMFYHSERGPSFYSNTTTFITLVMEYFYIVRFLFTV